VILDLIVRFERNHAAYHASQHNETQLRREFLDPFFEALGWDVSNRKQMTNRFRGSYFAVNKQALERLPFRAINFADPADDARHAHLIELVEVMLDLHRRLAAAKTPQDRTVLQRQIEAADQQIDLLVYELYNLTDDEIRIVEESGS